MKLWGQAILRGGIPLGLMARIAVALHAQGKTEDGRSTLCAALIFGVLGSPGSVAVSGSQPSVGLVLLCCVHCRDDAGIRA